MLLGCTHCLLVSESVFGSPMDIRTTGNAAVTMPGSPDTLALGSPRVQFQPLMPPPPQKLTVPSEQDALQVIQRLTGKAEATWTSKEQREAVLGAIALEHDILAILRTGSGKTMIPIVASQLEPDEVTVVVLPLKSLISDYQRRLKAMDIGYTLFQGQETTHLTGKPNLILVSADMAKTDHWKQCIIQLNQRNPVVRFCFDEGHLTLSSANFRPALANAYDLRLFPMQLIVMSGTIPMISQATVIGIFGLLDDVKVLRMPTSRLEINYHLYSRFYSNKDIEDKVVALIQQHSPTLAPSDRVLIFVAFIEEGIELATRLDCGFYHGRQATHPKASSTASLTDGQRLQLYHRWIKGTEPKDRIMVCTSAFGVGNDYPHVRLVIHAGTPIEMMGYTQESSRAGRDGEQAWAYILPYQQKAPVLQEGEIDHRGLQAAYNMIYGPGSCLRQAISAFNDVQGFDCFQLPNCQKCSHCCRQQFDVRRSMNMHLASGSTTPGPSSALSIKRRPQLAHFAEAVEISKQRRIERESTDNELVDRMQKQLAIYQKGCMLCHVFEADQGTSHHEPDRCPLWDTTGCGKSSKTDYHQWNRNINYDRNRHRGTCFKCHIPSCHDRLHPPFVKGQNNLCQYQGLLSSISFAIWSHADVYKAATVHFNQPGRKWSSKQQFQEWLTEFPAHTTGYTNLVALFLWYGEVYVA